MVAVISVCRDERGPSVSLHVREYLAHVRSPSVMWMTFGRYLPILSVLCITMASWRLLAPGALDRLNRRKLAAVTSAGKQTAQRRALRIPPQNGVGNNTNATALGNSGRQPAGVVWCSPDM